MVCSGGMPVSNMETSRGHWSITGSTSSMAPPSPNTEDGFDGAALMAVEEMAVQVAEEMVEGMQEDMADSGHMACNTKVQ